MTFNVLQMYHVAVEVPQDQTDQRIIGFNNHRFRMVRMSEAMTRVEALAAQQQILKAKPDSTIYVLEVTSVLIS